MADARLVVVKIGSNALADTQGRLDAGFLADAARQLKGAIDLGWRPVVVTSGAVSSGMAVMDLAKKPAEIPRVQALAAIGQARLMHHWQDVLAAQGLVAAQVLLTQDVFNVRKRYLNLANTMQALADFGAIPIINENDTVATEELTVGDNDRLSALVASQLGADLLVLLTDIAGYFDADPRSVASAKLVPVIERITPRILGAAGGSGGRGRGGMRSKLVACALASGSGVAAVIAHARERDVLLRAVRGDEVGTRVLAAPRSKQYGKRRWLAVARAVKGTITVDAGAAEALGERGSSLLPAGIAAIKGDFARGDTVIIADADGHPIARGAASLSADELRTVKGLRRAEAEKKLGKDLPKVAVHRDNLMLL